MAVFKKLVAVLCLVGSVLALYNVYSDVGPLQMSAERVACQSGACAGLIGMERTPIHVTFRFQVQRNQAATAQVRCQRTFLLAGEYTCAKE